MCCSGVGSRNGCQCAKEGFIGMSASAKGGVWFDWITLRGAFF